MGILIALAVMVTTARVAVLRFHDPQVTAWMRMRVRQARADGKELKIQQRWVPLSEISHAMQMAVIAAEDEKFYEHSGFDWEALKKAYERNEKSRRIKRGGSTITQQLAKNLYLSPGRSYWRKVREAWITLTIEWLLPKERILELYLNLVEFGPGIFGVEAAAQHYFRVPARQLAVNKACRLAAILPAPLRYRINGPYVSRRAAILERIIDGPPRHAQEQTPQIDKPAPAPPPVDQITDSLLRELEKVEQEEAPIPDST